jgi:hypothetical protein
MARPVPRRVDRLVYASVTLSGLAAEWLMAR